MESRIKILAAVAFIAAASAKVAFAYEVALGSSGGDAIEEKLAALDEVILEALEEHGHKVRPPEVVKEAMKKMAIEEIVSLKDAELLGSKLKVQFVVVARLTPLAGQDSIEINAYYLPDGRVEVLEEIAPEGETRMVVEGMLVRLITKEGVMAQETRKAAEKVSAAETGEAEKTGKVAEGAAKEEEERLLRDLKRWPKKKRFNYGTDYRVSLEMYTGPAVMLTSPTEAVGRRAGGIATVGFGYVAVTSCGCEFGGEMRALFGMTDAFSLAVFAGFNFRLAQAVPLYGGGRLSLGYLKHISGSRMSRMLIRGAANLVFVIRSRYMAIINPLSIMLLAFDGDPVALYEGGLGFGVRF